jgi:hypothetical protein
MEGAQHHKAFAVISVAKYITRAQHLENEFAEFCAFLDRMPEQWMFFKNSRLGLNFLSDDGGKMRLAIVQECGKSIEIGQRSRRSFQRHRPFQGRKSGVPQESSQRTTRSCGTVGSPALIAAHCRSSSAISALEISAGARWFASISRSRSDSERPLSAARRSSTSAVASSTSIVRLPVITRV